jgi:DNA-binding response OmpR family regulator
MQKQRIRILLVEDDINMGFLLVEYLENQGFDAKLYRNGETAFRAFKTTKYDFCILDVMLPDLDGFSLAKRIKSENQQIPIIFLTAKSLKEDKIKGFRIGVDDYITKPFDEDELLCRINAILMRVNTQKEAKIQTNSFKLGAYSFDYCNQSLKSEKIDKRLTTKESDILRMLSLSKNKIVRRENILISIWGKNDYFTGRSLDVFITKLRKYLCNDTDIQIDCRLPLLYFDLAFSVN